MIKPDSIETQWIKDVSKRLRADPVLVEKVVRALWMLEGIVLSGQNFVFKGGTALMLKFATARRLSIDIDIVMPSKPEGLSEQFNSIARHLGFTRVEEQKRETKSKIDKAHYKFYYKPVIQNSEEAYVLLDILFGDAGYQNIQPVKIENSFVSTEGEITLVQVPSFEDLTGDKLTAFAPNTTGIPYEKNGQSASMEIIKQLFDLGYLFDHITDLAGIQKTFEAIAKTELAYRGHVLTPDEVLDDTYHTALCLSTRGVLGKGDYAELCVGIKRLQPYIYSETYHIDKAITHVARIAYVTRLLQKGAKKIERFDAAEQIADWEIKDHSMIKLNKLKKANMEAFHYWYRALNL